jgi:hypothetical protein
MDGEMRGVGGEGTRIWKMQLLWGIFFLVVFLGAVVVAWAVVVHGGAAVQEDVESKSGGGGGGGQEAAGKTPPAATEVYMVLLEGQPVVAYKGGVPGLAETAQLFTQRWEFLPHRSR